MENENFWQEMEKVLHTLQVKEMELKSLTGEIYAGRILPYRTRENLIDGVVVTFIDVSAQHFLEHGQRLLPKASRTRCESPC